MSKKTIYDNIQNYSSEEEREYVENQWFEDELDNLHGIHTEGKILAIADLGLWNGRRQGYKVCSTSLTSILTAGNSDYIHLYYDGFNVRKTAIHHDGTNYILFREIRPNRNIDKFLDMIYNEEEIDNKTLNYYTKSLRKYVKKVYGF